MRPNGAVTPANLASRLSVVRHGESENNALGVECASISNRDLYGLTPRGRVQAARFASESGPFPLVISSPLRRALETARIFADASDARLVVDPLLIEMDVGEFEGRSEAECRAWKATQGSDFTRFPGGESRHDVRLRAARALEKLALGDAEPCVLFVSHGVFLSCLFEVVLPGFTRQDWEDYLEGYEAGRRVFSVSDALAKR